MRRYMFRVRVSICTRAQLWILETWKENFTSICNGVGEESSIRHGMSEEEEAMEEEIEMKRKEKNPFFFFLVNCFF
ncbi:hypothetical protein LguiB_006736 [Lonicera macranthoides]